MNVLSDQHKPLIKHQIIPLRISKPLQLKNLTRSSQNKVHILTSLHFLATFKLIIYLLTFAKLSAKLVLKHISQLININQIIPNSQLDSEINIQQSIQ